MDQYDAVDLPRGDSNISIENKLSMTSGKDDINTNSCTTTENHKIKKKETECRNNKCSLEIFEEGYDDLDETDYPHPDPSADPDSFGKRTLSSLDMTDFPLMNRNKLKTKSIVRAQEKMDGIIFTHTTYFPPKIQQKHIELSQEYLTTDSSCHYDMSSFPRGIFSLFNVEHYLQDTGMSDYPRKGTERDAEALCALFLELGFIVERYDNPTKKVMLNALDGVARDIGSLSCSGCAVLTHGEEGILYSSDNSIQIKEITQRFRTKSLAGKPKFFFFQACQGSDYMDSIDAFDGPIKEDEDVISLPCEADFFYAYSTVPGYYSWRNSRNGSWFMQSLCQVFRQNSHQMDLYRMFMRVNNQVSSRKSRTDDKTTDDKRQIAAIVSQMRKELFFFPPFGPLSA